MEKEIVIVTGSCGKIGSQVVKKLGEKYRIVGFELKKTVYASPDEELVPVDISSDASVIQAFSHIKNFYGTRIASVIHLAAYYSFSEKHSDKYDQITVKGTERILKALQEFDVQQFLFSSSMLVHAPTKPGVPITEESPFDPKWDYPLSKVNTEKLIHKHRGKIPAVIFRIAGVYDDMCHSLPISHQIQRIYEKQLEAHLFPGDLSHGASFVHMDDVVNAVWLAVEKRKEIPKDATFLIGEPETLSYDAIQKSIARNLFDKDFTTFQIPKILAKIGAWCECAISFKHKPFIRPWLIDLADDHYELDISKAQSILGWHLRRNLEATLPIMIENLKRDPINWYRSNDLRMSHRIEKSVQR